MNRSLIQQPLAIVGLACRLPGADDLDQFWNLLRTGGDAIGPFPEERLDRGLYFDPRKGVRGKSYTDLGGMIPNRPLNQQWLKLTPEQQQLWDPCHLIFAEVAANAWSHVPSLHHPSSRKVGVYIGHSGGSRESGDLVYATLAEQTASLLDGIEQLHALDSVAKQALKSDLVARMRNGKPIRRADGSPNLEASAASRIVSELLGLNGPQVVLDAACASSLVALGLASLAIQNGEIDAAIVGGASYNKCDSLVLFSNAQSCSATGSRPFDEKADGLISSEGYIAIVLKRLDVAIRDGDRIWAVLRGMGLASDGRGKSLWAPRREGQLAAVQRAYGPDVDPKLVQFVEAHATSTQVGDATEVQALSDFFGPIAGESKIPIGSVKSNIGHTLETAGLAGLLKSVLGMLHETIPPTIHLEQPSQSIPWSQTPFTVPTTCQPWPSNRDQHPRCAAVNAFGIGGLNVHVVLEQYDANYHQAWLRNLTSSNDHHTGETVEGGNVAVRSEAKPTDSIAIIGRGMILPGARDAEELHQLLANQRSQISDADPKRWLGRIGIREQASSQNVGFVPWQVATGKGGYLLDYAYDWRKHKVPPKQVERANPMQFMLLDAAGQAIEEANRYGKPLANEHTCVVVGTIFGGEFGHQLQLGLRLVELRRDLRATLERFGFRGEAADQILLEFESRLLTVNPALLDETGSFTSSTLASRITKQYNLLGGALAIDSGDSSAMAAIQSACHLLESGTVDTVVCACGQRAMDLPAFENQASHHWLSESSQPPRLPGEGVVVFVMRRTSDAIRDGQKIIATIDEITACSPRMADARLHSDHRDRTGLLYQAVDASEGAFRAKRIETGFIEGTIDPLLQPQLLSRYPHARLETPATLAVMGHLMGSQGALSLLANTCDPSRKGAEWYLHSNRDGLLYQMACTQYDRDDLPSQAPSVHSTTLEPLQSSLHEDNELSPMSEVNAPTNLNAAPVTKLTEAISAEPQGSWLNYRLQGRTWDDIRQQASRWLSDSNARQALENQAWDEHQPYRAMLVVNHPDELLTKLPLVRDCDTYLKRHALMRMGLLVSTPGSRSARSVAVIFPGQGSQHPEMLRDLLGHSSAAARMLSEAEACLEAIKSPSWRSLLTPRESDGSWHVQASMMISDACYWAALQEIVPKIGVVAGHSLGEYAALLAAEAWTLADALQLLQHRATAVDQAQQWATGLLSIPASLTQVRQWIADYPSPIYVTHHNSPTQTVVGGPLNELAIFEEWLRNRNVTATVLKVPAAFHTPLMAPAQVALAEPIRKVAFGPARTLLYSSAANRYVSDPREMRRALLDQLTNPVYYVELVQQLYDDGCRLFLECGPGQVLSRLHQSILQQEDAFCWSMDRADGNVARSMAELHAIRELFELGNDKRGQSAEVGTSEVIATFPRPEPAIRCYDATQRRRAKKRAQASELTTWADTTSPVSINRELAEQVEQVIEHQEGHRSASVDEETEVQSPDVPGGLESFLRDFIVEHTGYPGEMIELDWDLEADLGIDSIKQAQLFGELREMFDFDLKKIAVANVRTLRQLMEFLEGTGGKKEWLNDEPSPEVPPNPTLQGDASPQEALLDTKLEPIVASKPTSPASSDMTQTAIDAGQVKSAVPIASNATEERMDGERKSEMSSDSQLDRIARFMIDFVIEHTGYPSDVVDMQADFEADLGLDSIKLAQLFGELRSHFGLPVELDRQALARCRTLQDVLDLYQLPSLSPMEVATSEPAKVLHGDGASQSLTTDHAEAREPESLLPEWVDWGVKHRDWIRDQLCSLSDVWESDVDHIRRLAIEEDKPNVSNILQSIAEGAEVHPWNLQSLVVRYGVPAEWNTTPPATNSQTVVPAAAVAVSEAPDITQADNPLPTARELKPLQLWLDQEQETTHRYHLRLHPSPIPAGTNQRVRWQGAAAILGNNPWADLLEERLRQEQVPCFRFAENATTEQLIAQMDALWADQPIMHLFLATSMDPDALLTVATMHDNRRGAIGIRNPYWLCQRWMHHVMKAERMHDASLVALTRLGGDFGFQQSDLAPESGNLAGLLKAIMIESWVNGFRAIPIKVIDSDPNMTPSQTADAIWHELANNSFDIETAWRDGGRYVIRAERTPLQPPASDASGIEKGENWICTGGGRGITAAVGETLAKQYGVRLHLIGKSRLPSIPAEWRDLDEEGTKQLKLQVMQQARTEGRNSLTAWQDMEKVLEVDATLRRFAKEGIEAYYYDCDVSNSHALELLVSQIRDRFGAIRGCIHGAGVGQDARFDRKRPEKVEQCFDAKWDGTLALMKATWNDPLRFFVGFGSISGRFGANGHTDYSSANEGLAKLIGWYRSQRPEVKAVTFHWHAWGDIGMATKPETKLALEMIDMTFMPAHEGMRHFLRELEAGAPEKEVLITDDRYYRLFFPAETLVREQAEGSSETGAASDTPLPKCFALMDQSPQVDELDNHRYVCSLDPTREVFLREHCLQSRPLLPVVAGVEMLVEAAMQKMELPTWNHGLQGLQLTGLVALRGLRFFEDQPIQAVVTVQQDFDGSAFTMLQADFHARNGVLVERNRPYLQANIRSTDGSRLFDWPAADESQIDWKPVLYPDSQQVFYVGPSFQVLKKVQLDGARVFGRIIAPILVELAGAHRKAEGWHVPSAVLDACLFGTGILAWSHVRPGTSLPVGIEQLLVHRLPDVGEVLMLESRWKRTEGRFAWFDFALTGRSGRPILEAREYQICWLEAPQ